MQTRAPQFELFIMNTSKSSEPVAVPEFQVVGPQHAQALAAFFERLRANGDESYFHPHPLTGGEAQKRAAYCGLDFYCVLMQGSAVVAYGMLRGWDEGYEVPAIGAAVDPSAQGHGYGRLLMNYLHATARERGVKRIRVTVELGNIRSVAMCRSLGYVFQDPENGRIIGFLPMNPPVGRSPEEMVR